MRACGVSGERLRPTSADPTSPIRKAIATLAIVAFAWLAATEGTAAAQTKPEDVLRTWYGMILELVRHTPTYSPPVASRSFAYVGIAAFEATETGSGELRSLAGQINGLTPVPERAAGATYDEAVIMQATLATAVESLFSNTGPTGKRAVAAVKAKLDAEVADGVPADVVQRSKEYGEAVAMHVLNWAKDDGGAVVENMGFPLKYELTPGPAHWVPTSPIQQQQVPLLPNWGKNRAFAMPDGLSCDLPPPPEYSEDKGSQFYKEALEVYETKKNLTPEQTAIARFWSDDPMLSPTPPGHWISIALQLLEREKADLERSVETLALLGVTVADSFIGCWAAKYEFDLVRPVTYIKRLIDPKWEALLITPPFPEYPSGHSTQSGAAATVLTKLFGENHAFEDATRKTDGVKPRSFSSFQAAAEEAAMSRLYGGIHFRAAIERGLEQGRCIGAYATALKTRR
jgi:hypothetical protein